MVNKALEEELALKQQQNDRKMNMKHKGFSNLKKD